MSKELHNIIQTDWDNRDFVQNLSTGIEEIATFLTNFGKSMNLSNQLIHIFVDIHCRYNLAKLDEKLSFLERKVEMLEVKVFLVFGENRIGKIIHRLLQKWTLAKPRLYKRLKQYYK